MVILLIQEITPEQKTSKKIAVRAETVAVYRACTIADEFISLFCISLFF